MSSEQMGYIQGLWLARVAFLIIGLLLYNWARKKPGKGAMLIFVATGAQVRESKIRKNRAPVRVLH